MNAKTFLATTGEGLAQAALAPNGNWDVSVPRRLAQNT